MKYLVAIGVLFFACTSCVSKKMGVPDKVQKGSDTIICLATTWEDPTVEKLICTYGPNGFVEKDVMETVNEMIRQREHPYGYRVALLEVDLAVCVGVSDVLKKWSKVCKSENIRNQVAVNFSNIDDGCSELIMYHRGLHYGKKRVTREGQVEFLTLSGGQKIWPSIQNFLENETGPRQAHIMIVDSKFIDTKPEEFYTLIKGLNDSEVYYSVYVE